jgi:hypothetical protein
MRVCRSFPYILAGPWEPTVAPFLYLAPHAHCSILNLRGKDPCLEKAQASLSFKLVKMRPSRNASFPVASTRLTPLVGREEEMALVQRRWDQAKTGLGQVVRISGLERSIPTM